MLCTRVGSNSILVEVGWCAVLSCCLVYASACGHDELLTVEVVHVVQLEVMYPDNDISKIKKMLTRIGFCNVSNKIL